MLVGPTIVVVDDDENIVSAFGDFLKREGIKMVALPSTLAALRTMDSSRADLLIVDLRTPVEPALAFLQSVRTKHPSLPIIVITGYTESVTETDVKTLGATYFFVKPLDLDRLRDAVRKCLNNVSTTQLGG